MVPLSRRLERVNTKSNCLSNCAFHDEHRKNHSRKKNRKRKKRKEGWWKKRRWKERKEAVRQRKKSRMERKEMKEGGKEDEGERVGGVLPALQTAWCIAWGKWSEVLAPQLAPPHHHRRPQFQPHSTVFPKRARLYSWPY